jgi:hypothetical protein
MAETGAKMDYPSHEQGYAGFIALMKWGAVGCFIIAAIVILIISR